MLAPSLLRPANAWNGKCESLPLHRYLASANAFCRIRPLHAVRSFQKAYFRSNLLNEYLTTAGE